MRNLYVRLPDDAVDQLRKLAERELRGTKEQAAFLILDGLRRSDLPVKAAEPSRRLVRSR